jgi:hypothetical protein
MIGLELNGNLGWTLARILDWSAKSGLRLRGRGSRSDIQWSPCLQASLLIKQACCVSPALTPRVWHAYVTALSTVRMLISLVSPDWCEASLASSRCSNNV